MSWAYLFVLLAMWGLVRFAGDRWWVATLILFGPVWVTILPLTLLVPAALLFRQRALPTLMLAAGVAVFAMMGLAVPWRPVVAPKSSGQSLRIVTCNVHGKAALDAIESELTPDVIVLQEWPRGKEPALAKCKCWNIRQDGELLLASKYPILAAQDYREPGWAKWGGAAMRYDLDAPGGTLHLFNIHLASPHRPFAAVMHNKPGAVEWLSTHLLIRQSQARKVSQLAQNAGDNVILAGDFNTLCEGSIYRDEWSGFSDAFATAGLGFGATYLAEGAHVRIDHVLSARGWQCRRCTVGPAVGSPHRPVVADMTR